MNARPEKWRNDTLIRARVEAVKQFRLKSKKGQTKETAKTPYLFAEIRQPATDFVVVPQHTSERRKYIPLGFFSPRYIVHNSCTAIPNATRYHFGVLSSAMFMAWVRRICGRIKSDFRFSTNLVYNNFPWPETPPAKQAVVVASKAQAVLDARAAFPESSLADLYDPLTMPAKLTKAHGELDRAVDA